MDLSVIIVSWNVREKLKENLSALYKSEGDFSFEVFVVDNNSADGSAEMVKNSFPQVKLIANNENLGFGKANNLAIKQASGDFILLLNPDMQVFPDSVYKMLAWMRENSQAVIASCKLIDSSGNIIKQVRRFPKVLDQLLVISRLPHVFPKLLSRYILENFDYSQAASVDSTRGAFMMINLDAWRKITKDQVSLPLFDEQYFLWFDEVDLCRQIKEIGGEIWYTPAANCVDHVGQSFAQVKRATTQKYFRDSMLKYFKKWQPVWQYWILKFAWGIRIAIMKLTGVVKK